MALNEDQSPMIHVLKHINKRYIAKEGKTQIHTLLH